MQSLELVLQQPLPDRAERARLPALSRLLSRARASVPQPLSIEAGLLSRFEVARQRDWPVAPLARLGDGAAADGACWMCADPVHLQVDRDALVLVAADHFEIDADESQALVHSLDMHFAPVGIHFEAAAPKRWYARLDTAPDVETVPLREAAGRSVDERLPHGADALAWHRLFNEVQMLLHAHPVNEAREARGVPAINSVWFWGAGTLPARVAAPFAAVWSRNPLARGLAAAGGAAAMDLPEDFARWRAAAAPGSHLAMIGQPDAQTLESRWLAPALQALRDRSLATLTLWAPAGPGVQRFDVAGADLWKFWRRAAA
jgi:hypothetical protein